METPIKYTSYKKLLIFGSESSGKTSLTKRLEKDTFQEESHSENGNIFYNYILNIIYIKNLLQDEYQSNMSKIKN